MYKNNIDGGCCFYTTNKKDGAKMKKISKIAVLMLLSIVFTMSAVSCGSGSTQEDKPKVEKSPEDIVESAVTSRAWSYANTLYDISGLPDVFIATCNETEENLYEVYGKVNVKDNYGDSYTGKFEAIAEYNPETKEADVTEFDMETPTKDR